jgi:hypothetical protein
VGHSLYPYLRKLDLFNLYSLLYPTLDATAGQTNLHLPTNLDSSVSYDSLYTNEMALLSADHLAGPGYIILNVLRGLNIIALASVVASSVVMLVKTFIISKVRQ